MPAMDDSRPLVTARDRTAWRRWLSRNHARASGAWLVKYKKASNMKCVPYDEAVEEALCFGWIDSVMKPVNDEYSVQLFTPRRARSAWAASNKRRVERLMKEGLMTPAGLAAIEVAKANGSWSALDDVEALIVPEDLARALRRTKGARRNFDAFSPSVRKQFLYRIAAAKKPETRAKRVAETVAHAAANRRLDA